jgi:superfamily II DNA helicase RecQ
VAFKFFTVPIQDSAAAEGELNSFLRAHQVLNVDRRFIEQGPSSLWVICVDYLDAAAARTMRGAPVRGKVDYKEVLPPAEFAAFSRLRELRKQMAQSDAVPVYTVFTNEQLAQMVQQKAATKADLERIVGVGDARVQKYGERVLETLAGQWSSRAANGQTV